MEFRTKKDYGFWFFAYGIKTGPAHIITVKVGQ